MASSRAGTGRPWASSFSSLGVTDCRGVIAQIRAGRLVGRDTLHTQLTWQGWNIVEGPGGTNRAPGDDPGEAFDSWSGAGMSTNQRNTLAAVKLLYVVMQKMQNLPSRLGTTIPNINARDAKALENALKSAKSSLRGKAPMPWNDAMWVVVTEGRVEKGRSVWYTPPTWRKRRSDDPVGA